MEQGPNPDEEGAEDGAIAATAGDPEAEASLEKDADATVPSTPALPERENMQALTVVGVGGSAGSISALQAFFENVHPSGNGSGSAYVVVLHLSADYESHLPEVLARSSKIPVHQVTQDVRIQADQVYVIPPGKDLEMWDGSLRLSDRDMAPGRRVVIDTFFRTLALAHGSQSAAVVFSGTGADGTLGIRQIKEAGGLVVAQSPSEAEYDAMPRSAIATGLVDYVLPVAAMPAQIAAYWETSRVMRIPAEAAPSPEQQEEGADQEAALQDVLTQVRVQTGHDFAFYKRATVLRRIGRRMQVNGVTTLPAYRDFLRTHPAEVGGLMGDLLISVTQFFRDPEAWAMLERDVIAQIFAGKIGSEGEIRVWVCGCATGEEAYTLAILLLEQAERMPQPPRVQVFATDMDLSAIARARAGIYPETIIGDVSEERLRRWFYRQDRTYQVRKEVREVVLFAHHDVLRDTPFSRLDLVTCRNLLIYLNREAQERVFRTFHFALRPDSGLMLGPAEGVEGADGLFLATNKQHRLFTRRSVPRAAVPPLSTPLFPPDSFRQNRGTERTAGDAGASRPVGVPPGSAEGEAALSLPPPLPSSRTGAGSVGNVLRDLLPRYGPPVAIVNDDYVILHLSGSVSDFLRFPDGEPTFNLLELVHPYLRPELRGALFEAAQEGTEQTRVVRSAGQGEPENAILTPNVRLSVRPVLASSLEDAPRYFVVRFEGISEAVLAALRPLFAETPRLETTSAAPDAASAGAAHASVEVARRLEQENAALGRDLRIASEQYDVVTEELTASNEEMQSTNEEIRSVVEELETGKEELQSVNEELSTVNYELKARVEELTTTNSDLANFLGATDIATLFLDRVLNVKRFTSSALALFNLIPTDIGRPLAHVTNRLDYSTLEEDANAVLARLIPVEREVTSKDRQHHYLVRLLPYRSLEDRVEGVVVNFIDISARKQAERAKFFLASIVESSHDSVVTVDFDGTITSWNKAAEDLYGYLAAEAIGKPITMLTLPGDLAEMLRHIDDVKNSRGVVRFDTTRRNKGGRARFLEVVMSPVKDAGEAVIGVSTVARDITEHKQAKEQLRAAALDAFRVTLGDALGGLSDPVEVQAVASRVLGEHLVADRAYYVEIQEASQQFIVAREWMRLGAPSHARRYPLKDWAMPWLDNGRTWVMEDSDSDPVLPDEQRASYRGNDIRAAVVVPLLKEARLVATFVVNQNVPREWKPEEVEMARETAERTWAAVERARVEEALRASEEKYRTLFESIDEGFCTIEVLFNKRGKAVDYRFLETNLAFERQTGLENAVGKTMCELAPEQDSFWFETYGRIAKTGEATRFEHESTALGRFYDVYASRIGEPEENRVAILFNDISERKRAEEAVRESEGRLRALVENLPGGAVLIVDKNLRYLIAEGEALTAAGFKPEDLIGRTIGEAMPPEVAASHESLYRKALAGEAFEHEHEAHDRALVSRGVPLTSANGDVYAVLAISYDITERRRAEEAVHASETRLRLATEAGGIATWEWNIQTDEVIWNEQHFLLFGMEPRPNPLPPEEFFRHVHPRDRARVRKLLEKSVVEKNAFETDFRAVLEDGETRWMNGYGRIIEETASGEAAKMSGLMFDITDRKRAEEALRHSEQRLRTLADAVPQVIWTNTSDGTANYFNRRWYDYSGLTYKQSVGLGWEAIVHPDDAPASVAKWQRALAMGEIFDTDYRLRGADGKYRWFLGRNIPLKDAAGAVTGWFGSATDIEEWKQAQVARQESEERFRLLVEGAREYAMFLLDPNGRITFWSLGSERVFGWNEAEAVGQTMDMIFTPEDRERGEQKREMEIALSEGRAPDRRWHVRKGDSRFWADGILMRLDDEAGNVRGFAKIARDATEQKRAQEALQAGWEAVAQANETLEQRVQERTEELTEMGLMRQELLRELVTAQEEERAKISRDLHDDTGQQITALLLGLNNIKNFPAVADDAAAQDLLTHLQDMAGEVAKKSHRVSFTLRPTTLDDLGLIQALTNYAEEWSRWSDLPITVENVGFDEEPGQRLPPEVETTIYRVTQEALTNILRYATGDVKGVGTAATRVGILVQRRRTATEDTVLAMIEDDGPGFDVEAALSQPPGKRRLGIFGMQERARLAGGTLEIESAPGEGTTVYLRLPMPS